MLLKDGVEISEESLLGFAETISTAIAYAFKDISVENIAVWQDKAAYIVGESADAFIALLIGEGAIKRSGGTYIGYGPDGLKATLDRMGAESNRVKGLAVLLCDPMTAIYAEFFEYYLARREWPPYFRSEEWTPNDKLWALGNKLRAEHYMESSCLNAKDRAIPYVWSMEKNFTDMMHGAEAFEAYIYYVFRILEYVYVPMKKTGTVKLEPIGKDYPYVVEE